MRDDLKAALRSLNASRTFTVVALIVLALGIGASTAIFSVVDAVVLRGLPFDEHDRLVAVGERRPPGKTPDPNRDPAAVSSASPQNYVDWAAQLRRQLEIPRTLAALGMSAEHIPVLAPRAVADPSAAGNPIALSEADYADLYRRALAG